MQQVENVLNAFEAFRMQPTAIDEYEAKGKNILREKLLPFINKWQPIKFVMLGFPFKSGNTRDKVLGKLPDMAEEVTIANFASFNKAIKQIYEPGAVIQIVNDGLMFNDVWQISDNAVYDYHYTNNCIGKYFGAPMQWFTLNDFYSGNNLADKRERAMQQFGITWPELEQRILFDANTNWLYKGMLRFMSEELAYQDFPSRTQREKLAKKLVRESMLRNEAFSNLVNHEFTDSVRLSMHKTVNDGAKYSFKLIPGNNSNHSAWHCALLIKGGEFITIHRKDAELAGYDLQFKNGRPYNYVN